MMRNKGARTVLVVDDEVVYRARIGSALTAKGFKVIKANNIAQAMLVDEECFDIGFLVSDISLPDGNGCSLAVSMRTRRPELRVLFVSFQIGIEAGRYHGLTTPDLHVLRKPFSDRQLLWRFQKILKSAEPFPYLYGTQASG